MYQFGLTENQASIIYIDEYDITYTTRLRIKLNDVTQHASQHEVLSVARPGHSQPFFRHGKPFLGTARCPTRTTNYNLGRTILRARLIMQMVE